MRLTRRVREAGSVRSRYMGDLWSSGMEMAAVQSGYPVSEVLTDNLSSPAKAWGQRASQAYLSGTTDIKSVNRTIGSMGVLGLNRTPPSAPSFPGIDRTANQVRFSIDEFPIRRRPAISATNFTVTNLTGASTDLAVIDPPEDTVTAGYTPTRLQSVSPAANTVVRLDFTNHHDFERPLTGTLRFRVRTADSALDGTFPDITVELLANGVAVVTLVPDSREKASEGFIENFSFPAASFPGGTIGLRITGRSLVTSVPEPCGAELICDQAGVLYDSGWLEFSGDQARVLPDYEISSGEFAFWLVEFSDFHETLLQTYSAPPGFIGAHTYTPLATGLEIGRFVAAETIEFQPATSDGRDFWNIEPAHDAQRVRLRRGSLRGGREALMTERYTCRGVFKTAEEALDDLLKGYYKAIGPQVPVLVIPHVERPQDDVWAIIDGFSCNDAGVVAGVDGTGRKYDIAMTFLTHGAQVAPRG